MPMAAKLNEERSVHTLHLPLMKGEERICDGVRTQRLGPVDLEPSWNYRFAEATNKSVSIRIFVVSFLDEPCRRNKTVSDGRSSFTRVGRHVGEWVRQVTLEVRRRAMG